MKEFPCYLYHICRKQDKYNLSEGYIGISRKPSKRWSSGGYKDNPHLMAAFKKYEDIIKYVIKIGTRKECLANEIKLRPQDNIGWNIVKGGGNPPNARGKPHCISNLPNEKRRKHYKASDAAKINMRTGQQKYKIFHSERMLGDKNPMFGLKGKEHPSFSGYYITPEGRFESESQAACAHKIGRDAVRRRCKIGGVIKANRWQTKECWGKTWKELGWYFEEKINEQ